LLKKTTVLVGFFAIKQRYKKIKRIKTHHFRGILADNFGLLSLYFSQEHSTSRPEWQASWPWVLQ